MPSCMSMQITKSQEKKDEIQKLTVAAPDSDVDLEVINYGSSIIWKQEQYQKISYNSFGSLFIS